jgi:hypothetical protein
VEDDICAHVDLIREDDDSPHFRSYEGMGLENSEKSLPFDVFIGPCPKKTCQATLAIGISFHRVVLVVGSDNVGVIQLGYIVFEK